MSLLFSMLLTRKTNMNIITMLATRHVPRDQVKEVRTDTLLPPTRTVGGRPRVMKSRAAM